MQRVEKDTIDALEHSLAYHVHHFPGTTTTVAIAVLPNGFTVGVGKSACLDQAMFDADVGVTIAKEQARKQSVEMLWALEGYKVKSAP